MPVIKLYHWHDACMIGYLSCQWLTSIQDFPSVSVCRIVKDSLEALLKKKSWTRHFLPRLHLHWQRRAPNLFLSFVATVVTWTWIRVTESGGEGGSSYSERYTVQICYHSAVWTSFHERLLISSYGTIVNVYRLSFRHFHNKYIFHKYKSTYGCLRIVSFFFDRKKTKTSIVNSNSAGTEMKEA